MRGWLDAKPDPQFAEKCHDICQTYRLAPEHAAAGIPTFSIDEMTGIQALERIAQTLPVKPGRVEWREFEYTRHGTSVPSSLASTSATGEASADIDETRAEEDFAAHLAALVQQPRMHLAMDNLNTHYSESAVRLVAEHIGFEGVPFHTQTRFLAQPDRNLVLHPGASFVAKTKFGSRLP